MKIIFGLLLLCGQSALAQHKLIFKCTNEDTHQPIAGASVMIIGLDEAALADSNGIAFIRNLPNGSYHCRVSCIGYKIRELPFTIPFGGMDTLKIKLEPSVEMLQDVIVSTTRLNQRLKNSPVNIEVIGREDIEEGTAMSPGNIRELLSELSGTQVQQTSAVSGNTTIRLQGLDGRYTQLLKDGFPLYGGFSGNLSVLQIPPLDLQQVEIIKGSGSALYGGDAIAGIINLISKSPDTLVHEDVILNQTLKKGTDLSGFYSKRNYKTGVTLLATTSLQQPLDVNADGFTDLPRIRQFTITPSFFWYPDDKTILKLDINISHESRAGGDIQAVEHGTDSLHPFLEISITDRNYYQLNYTRKLTNQQTLTFKNSIGYFYRSLDSRSSLFSGTQLSSFSEISYQANYKTHQDIIGMNIITDKFTSKEPNPSLGYEHNTIGLFAQDDWKLNRQLTLETGIRSDFYRTNYFLPRVDILYNATPQLTVKLGGGLAYKLPTIFNALTEVDGYQKVYPLSSATKTERSASANLALNFHGNVGDDLHFYVDQNFYYTHLTNALIPQEDSLQNGWLYYINAPGSIHSSGFETNVKLSLEELSFLISYTFTDARREYKAKSPQLPLTPQSRFVAALLYEKETSFRVGVESFFTGNQYLDDGTKTKAFWTFDAMVEKIFGHFSVLINVENFTDTRQSRFGPLYSGTVQNPVFKEVYAPIEGIVGNIAFRFRL